MSRTLSSRTLLRRTLALACLWVATAWPGALCAQSSDLERGRAARAQGDHERALAAFEAAWTASAAPIARAEMAREELALGRFVLAEAHANEALAFGGVPEIDAVATELAALRDAAATHLGSLEIRCSAPACTLSVDGVAVGASPLDHLVRVEAGTHLVRAELDRHTPAESQVDVAARAVARVELAPVHIDERPILERIGGTGDGQRIAAYTAFAAGGVALVIGAVALGVELDRDAFLRSGACTPTSASETRETTCPDAASTRSTYTDVARALLFSAGVLGIAGIILFVTAPSAPADPSAAQVRCLPTGLGVACAGTF